MLSFAASLRGKRASILINCCYRSRRIQPVLLLWFEEFACRGHFQLFNWKCNDWLKTNSLIITQCFGLELGKMDGQVRQCFSTTQTCTLLCTTASSSVYYDYCGCNVMTWSKCNNLQKQLCFLVSHMMCVFCKPEHRPVHRTHSFPDVPQCFCVHIQLFKESPISSCLCCTLFTSTFALGNRVPTVCILNLPPRVQNHNGNKEHQCCSIFTWKGLLVAAYFPVDLVEHLAPGFRGTQVNIINPIYWTTGTIPAE